LKVGETVTVRAIVENAKAEDNPLTYNWSGTFNGKPEDYKKSAGVEIKPVKPGKYTLTVGVDGARFGMGGASLEYEVLDYKAEIKQVSPTASKVVLGVPVSFSAQLLAGGAPVSGSYVYRWQPQPEAKFEPAEGAGNQTKAVFSRPGRTKVWVQVLEKRGEVLETVAESAQIEIEAVSPALRIAFFPAQVNVGKEVRARVEVTPADLKEIDFRWEISANAKQTFISPDTREVTFIPQDTNPVSVKVHARVPFYGDDLGVQTASIAATLSQADIDKATAAANLTKAKEIIRKGQLDEAVALLDEAVRLDAKNAEAAALSAKTKNEMTIIKTQLEKFRALIQESRFPEAQKELIVASNINSYYKPVADAEVELGDSWRKYDAAVKEKLGAMQVANEYRQFRKTLDIAVQTRAELKLYGYDLERFNSFENWAQSHEAEKERQRAVLKRGEEKYRNYDFAGAYEDLNVMFAKGDFYEYWNSNYDTEPAYYQKLKDDAFLKMKRINELLPNIRSVAADERLAAPIVEKAIADCDEILKIQPPNAEAAQLRAKLTERLKTGTNTVKANEAVKRGEALHAEKKYDAAIREFDTAIKLVPNNAEAYRLRGRSKRENGDLRGSLDDFNRALEIEPNNSRSFLGRGLTRDRMNDSQGALADYTHGIELEPNYPNGYSYRGYLKTQLKDFKGAIADYDMVVALEPNNRDAYLNRGFSKAHLGDCPGAVRDYNRVIEIDPNYALAYNNRGTCREKAGDLPGALQDYEKAAGLDPSSEIFKNNLAKLKTKLAGTQTPVTTPTTKQPETEAVNVGNIYGVNNAPTAPTEFSVRTSYMLTFIQTYHWNYGRGAQPGTIAVRKDDGTVFGPWRAGTKPGQGGVPNAYWEVTPNVVIPAGTYTIIDSDPSTWSQNAQSGGRGFAVVKGSAVSQSNAPTTNTPTTAERMRISVTYVNASKQNIHIFATGENFSPENRLAPGGRRTASGEGPKFTQITVYAGANGKVFDQVTFDVVPNGKYLVTFGSNNQLTFIKQ
jgi:tetratricopeptide (TPR) repeat protein